MAKSAAQSDDCYYRITFTTQDNVKLDGTVGWREGIENRVVFQVWDGPSFSAVGENLTVAFDAARTGIMREGFTPQPPADGSLDDAMTDLFSRINARESAALPRLLPVLWLLVTIVLLALLMPALARAETPEYGTLLPFPNAPYDYRYEGPNYDTRDGSRNSAARMRHEANERGDPNWLNLSLDPIIAILKRGSNKVVARYRLEGGQFCGYEEDNCELDGIFPLVLSSVPNDPVLVMVRHIGAHGQRISVLRPLVDRKAPVFEATADFALALRLRSDGLEITVDRAMEGGEVQMEHLAWPGDAKPMPIDPTVPDIALSPAPPYSASASAFEAQLRAIAASRDLAGFTALLSNDVLVSFGGNGGKAEFAEQWRLDSETGPGVFWNTLDRLLAQGGWNEAGGKDDDGEPYPQRLTWPWFFTAWQHDDDPENVFIANEAAPVRAAPHDTAPVLARLPRATVLHGRLDDGDEALEWVGHGWLGVNSPDGGLGFVAQEDIVPLLETRMIAVETAQGWKIEALVAGD